MNNPAAFETSRRVEAWAGEVRVNLVRTVALVAFYGYHLIDIYLSRDDPSYTPEYRASVAAVAAGWAGVIAIAYAVLRQGRLPAALPYLTVAADAALVAAVVIVSGGPRSPLVLLFLLVVAAAPLRLSLPVVYWSTAAAGFGYLVALGHYVFVRVGMSAYYSDPAVRISRPQEVITILGNPHRRTARRAGRASIASADGRRRGGWMMSSDIRCSSCDRSVSPDFRYCPYCQAELRHRATGVSEVSLAPGERQGHRDLGVIGWGLVILGLFGCVGAVLSLFGGRGSLDLFWGIGGGALLLVLAGFVMAGVARGGASGVASGLAMGCGSVAAIVGIGALLVLAMIGYAFLSCISDLNKLGH